MRVISRSGSTRRRGFMVTKTLLLTAVFGASLVAGATVAHEQAAPTKITIGIYTPTVEFPTAQARLQYAQSVAKAIETNTSIKTEAQSYASLAALKKDAPDY